MPADPRRIKELFGAALDLANPQARQALLDRECGMDAELRQRVEDLLTAHDAPHPDLKQPLTVVPEFTGAYQAQAAPSPVEAVGAVIDGKYKLLQEIGEGGMGSVFMADQTHPVKRRVAVKVIKAGMDSARVLARFEAERQALALMDHPNIARVLDAGTTDAGRPYFVMDLVKGVPLTQFCDDHKLPVPDRLHLFVHVCSAVQHAHQKGIIHRDLKPSNILVESHDGKPVPKVIDFGLAKATSGIQLTEQTLFTALGAVAGTPLYMAPEQAAFNAIDVDTRSDIYALGVILYELLTGTTPIERSTLKTAAFDEILRVIREQEPATPSSRLSSSDAKVSVAALRQTEPVKLGRFVKGELDWIVMKALSKERARRYETANGFARDIERFLNHEPLVAGPPRAGYKLRKFVRRNRGAVVAVAAVAAALLIGIAGFAWQARVAGDQRDLAIAAREAEGKERHRAEAERDKSEMIAEFMSDTLKGAGPSKARGRDITMLKEMMDGAAARIEKGDLTSAPEAELRLHMTIGSTYRELALYAESAKLLEPAVALARSLHAADHADTAMALGHLALLLKARGDLAGAEPLFREALAMKKRLFPGDHPEVATGLNNLALLLQARGDLAGAEPLYRESLAMRKRNIPGDHRYVAANLNNLALLLHARGILAAAEPLYRESLAMNKRLFAGDHPDVSNGLDNLATLLQARGDLAAAEPLYRESLAINKRLFPGDHPHLATSLLSLASLLHARGDLAAAEPLARDSLAMKKRLFPGDHPFVAKGLGNLAGLLQTRGDMAGAETLSRESLEMNRRLFSGDHPNVANDLNERARLVQARGDLPGAEALFRESLAMNKRLFADDHLDVATVLSNLASLLQARGDLAGAEPLLRDAHAMIKRLFPGDHPNVAAIVNNLASLLLARGDMVGAEPFARDAVAMYERTNGKDQWLTGNARLKLGRALAGLNRFAEAETELIETQRVLSTAKGVPPGRHQLSVEALVTLYETWEKAEPGKSYDAKAHQWKAKLEATKPPAPAPKPDEKKK